MQKDRIPRVVTLLSGIAVFVAAASWAEAQVPSLPRSTALVAPRLPVLAPAVQLPTVSVDGRVVAGSQVVLTTRNIGAPANGRRVRVVRTSDGQVAFLSVVTWAADRVTASVPAQPFGAAFDGSVAITIGIWDGSRWVGIPSSASLVASIASRGPRPAGCDTRDWDRDGRDAIACGGDDCDDADPGKFPGNAEVCDAAGHDEDCDVETFGSLDADGDGSVAALCCNADDGGGRFCGDDCNDNEAGAHHGSPEVCDGQDNDCDGLVDEYVQLTLWSDRDGDGFGDPTAPRAACGWSAGLSYVPNDCNDADRRVFMGQGCE